MSAATSEAEREPRRTFSEEDACLLYDEAEKVRNDELLAAREAEEQAAEAAAAAAAAEDAAAAEAAAEAAAASKAEGAIGDASPSKVRDGIGVWRATCGRPPPRLRTRAALAADAARAPAWTQP